MKYYERLSPVNRRRMVLRAVEVDSNMEGMDTAREECVKELRDLDRQEVSSMIVDPIGQKAG